MTFKDSARKRRITKKVANLVGILILTSLSYIVLFQLLYMFSYALRPLTDNYDTSIIWLPSKLTLDNFKAAIRVMEYELSLWRTVSVMIVSGLIQVFTCALVGYGFARFKFKEKNLLFFFVIMTIIVPAQMLVAPTYVNYSQLDFLGILGGIGKLIGTEIRPNIIDTPWTFYLPSLTASGLKSGLMILIYRQFFVKLPGEFEEAAWVDGAGPLRTFISIILPSSGVVILTVFIFSMIWHWNDYYQSTIYLSGKLTLSSQLKGLSANLQFNALEDSRNLRMAGCLLFVAPMLLMYLLLQKRFIKSVDRVGIVG